MYKHSFFAAALLLAASCSQIESTDTQQNSAQNSTANSQGLLNNELPLAAAQPGVLHIRVSKAAAQQFALQSKSQLVQLNSVPTQLMSTLNSIGTREMEALFPIDPRWEKRMKAEGLDQWYIVRFDEKNTLQSAMTLLGKSQMIELVEPQYQIELKAYKPARKVTPKKTRLFSDNLPFNDPGLKHQWHYHNDGKLLDNSVQGADANVFEAWEHETGKPNVIVSVVDGGIDITHEDLKDNLWVNSKEIPDNDIDDDGNGFIDDIHGWDFNGNKKEILPDGMGHGTHVAGTVAARNNNGLGVAGVAGGNGSKNSGVRLMSCQTFAGSRQSLLADSREDDLEKTKGGIGATAVRAIVYGANNGAVISQNSWGYRFPGVPQIPSDVKAAIDYFRKWAGCDNDGNQLPESPMKGGVVIFAAGNDATDYLCFPAAYEGTIAVASFAPNWKKASYSNMGTWVDVIAPGGDDGFPSSEQGVRAGEVYSTLPGNRYGYMAGTSMACPHVSGIAALVISKHGKQGFTAQQLENILLISFRPQSVDRQNPEFVGRLGKGYIDAGVAFAEDQKIAPNMVGEINNTPAWTSAHLQWKAVGDTDDKTAVAYRVYLDTNPITEGNKQLLTYQTVNALGVNEGETVEHVLKNLNDDTNYYVGISGVDRWGNVAQVKTIQIRTKRNHLPEFHFDNNTDIRVSIRQRAKITIPISDADGHALKVSLSGEERGVSHTFIDNQLTISIAKIAPVGKYNIQVKATDEYGKESLLNLPFQIYDYVEPTFVASNNTGLPAVGVNSSIDFDLKKIVQYSPELTPNFGITITDGSTLRSQINEAGIATFTGLKQGKTQVRITMNDGVSPAITKTFEIRVAPNVNNVVYTVYPIPATRDLNIVLNSALPQATFEIISPTGRRVFSQNQDIDNGKVKLDIRSLTPGSYVLKVKTDLGTSTHNFVKL